MKLFDLTNEERKSVSVFLTWHLGYAIYVGLFAYAIYRLNLFKAYWFLKEFWILNLIAPLHTLVFIAIGPYRRAWVLAIRNMHRALDGDVVFFSMAVLVMFFGFYLYNAFIWGLGSLIPSIFFT
ncbi:MAG: hypothetical protein V1816_18895 [Pseudomonadota bacterium]